MILKTITVLMTTFLSFQTEENVSLTVQIKHEQIPEENTAAYAKKDMRVLMLCELLV